MQPSPIPWFSDFPAVCQQFSINNCSAASGWLLGALGMGPRDWFWHQPNWNVIVFARSSIVCRTGALDPRPPHYQSPLGRLWLHAVNDAATKCRLHMLPLPWEIDEESERKREMGKRENEKIGGANADIKGAFKIPNIFENCMAMNWKLNSRMHSILIAGQICCFPFVCFAFLRNSQIIGSGIPWVNLRVLYVRICDEIQKYAYLQIKR